MIKINHLTNEAVKEVTKELEHWLDLIEIVYDEFAELYNITLADNVPVFIKYWNGVNDNSIYVHIGSKILSVRGEVTIC